MIRYDAAAGYVVLVEYHSVLSMIRGVVPYVRSEVVRLFFFLSQNKHVFKPRGTWY